MNKTLFTPSSGLGWIDFSAEDKGKVMKVIELLKAEGTVDELGIGIVRNSLSDALFNGITTIQSRAKYFFIVPRILQTYLSLKPKPKNGLEYLYKEETRIMNELTWGMDNPKEQGIIGYTVALENKNISERRWKQVERKPSTIYWNGLRTYKIFNSQYSLANFLKAVERNELNTENLKYVAGDGEKGDDNEKDLHANYYFNLPPYSSTWDTDLRIELTETEASFLKHRIIDTQKERLIALILGKEDWMKQFIGATNFEEMTRLPFINELPDVPRIIVYLAKDFWTIMFGAHIRFNILLQEYNGNTVKKGEIETLWNTWWNDMENFDWNGFDKDLMWEITESHSKIKPITKRFINGWIDGVKNREDSIILDKMVSEQEKYNKGNRAKLRDSNDEIYNKWIGIDRMEFRFENVKQIIKDIANGLKIIND